MYINTFQDIHLFMDIKMEQNNQVKNPLAQFFRQPKIYMSLPSNGKFYPTGALEMPENGELPVFAMTAKDELLMRTPDALMNGASTVEVIKSCVPNIKNPWFMPSIDVDAVLIAIRYATYGQEMDVGTTCPKCSEQEDKAVDLRSLLDSLRQINFSDRLDIDNDMILWIRPLTYDQITRTALKTFEQQRIFSIINDESISDDRKLEMFQSSFIKLTDLTIDSIADSIDKIECAAGIVTEPAFIKEFLANTDKKVFSIVQDAVTKSRDTGKIDALQTECPHCKHQYQVTLSFDQSDFFAGAS
jgi:bacterioferritin-associated ferredoxin